ncbi:hypothetical protein FALCPG4_003091 [Fusarium falciforme]
MRGCEQVPPSPPGGTDAAASAASASRSAHRQAAASDGQHDIPEADRQPKSGGGGDQHATTSGDPRPSVGGAHPADEPRSPQSASRQATANDQGNIPATNHTPEAEAEASVPEDKDVVMGDSDAAQGEGNAGSGAADHRSARSSAPEDDTGGDRSEANPQTQPTTANPTSQGAGAQVSMQSPFSATPEERTIQLPTTPNSQGSDTTKDTSRATTPNTHLTSPDTSVPDSPP